MGKEGICFPPMRLSCCLIAGGKFYWAGDEIPKGVNVPGGGGRDPRAARRRVLLAPSLESLCCLVIDYTGDKVRLLQTEDKIENSIGLITPRPRLQ
jgi:hypothetical protein